ncbi:uncharacterized protein C8orf58 homolog isoform X1 [Varanus komodoensis]|uniref:uncharacterized protein C8orf58 homolog isoform X1 n=1 Tax=Varanus komodoensis TaxID=61221 RepID=UPI001CF7DF18|nr:uncharacterized protein C8orf58 homolog isoform X1 [Varanus komodoensis]
MLRMRRVLSVEPFWNRGATWRPVESCVVLTSVSMYRKLQDPQPKLPLSLELDDGSSGEAGQWGEASSPTEPVSRELSFLPVSGRLVKSESEDSGVEMASNDQSPSTPLGSDKSFSLDCLDGFQPSGGDSPPLPSHESSPKTDGLEDSSAGQDRAYRRNLSVSKKLAQVVQRSQKHRLPGRSPRMLNRRSRSLVDPEGLDSYHLCRPAGVDGVVGAAAGEFSQALSGYSSPEEESIEEEVHREPPLTMPGQGLRYLEHICQMLEKIAHLQRANLQLQHQQQVMEDRIRAQELENQEGIPEVALEPGPELARVEPLPEASAAPGVQGDGEEDPSPQGSWHPHHFRARSASDTRVLWSPVHNQGKKTDYSRKTASHFASSPSLMDQQDGGVHTLPPGMKFKNDHSNWGKVKVLINRITRKSAQASEPTSSGGPAPSKPCGVDLVLGKQESHPRRHFLPTLGAKKRRSKHLSMR